jgi:putative SOS response-associated peptidase YedK
MCNEVARRIAIDELRGDWGETRIPLRFPEGIPNMAPLDSIRITDPAVIIRQAAGDVAAEVVTRRWSWPGPGGRPVYNFRSDGRRLDHGRCLIPVTAFFEFTAPPPGEKRKARWSCRLVGHDWFCIAGLWRSDDAVGEAFTMLTCPPGPDIARVHDRQMVVLGRDRWGDWLDPARPAAAFCQPLTEGALSVERG